MGTSVFPQQIVRGTWWHPNLRVSLLVLTDVFSLALSGFLAIMLHWFVQGIEDWSLYFLMVPFVFLFVVMFGAMGLYSGISASPSEELRKTTIACLLVSMCVAVSTLSIRQSHVIFTWTIGAAVLFSLIAVPGARELLRYKCARSSWWGYPTILLGDEESCRHLILTLRQSPQLGLKPVAVLGPNTGHVCGLPVIGEDDLGAWKPLLRRRGYALLSGSSQSRDRLMAVISDNRQCFPHVLVVPEVWEFSSFWVAPKDLNGVLGLEIREHLFKPSKQILKRILDLTLIAMALPFALPLLLLIAMAVKLDSPGPIFYGQRRVGRGGKPFKAWKFRSMQQNAEALLANYLAEHPDLAEEWNQNHKLRSDPRVTRLGRFLRKSSLDELPQLWNVLRGEMSLVGPRPIVQAEIARYGKYFDVYASVQSGLTGLWQISGRSETSYAERVTFDTFYVRNWSVWLDLYILLRTVGVICLRTGAY